MKLEDLDKIKLVHIIRFLICSNHTEDWCESLNTRSLKYGIRNIHIAIDNDAKLMNLKELNDRFEDEIVKLESE